MNYIELFANGGLTKSEKSEGEQRAIQLLESLQELTGVDPKQAAEILNQFKDDPETVNSIQEYVNLAIDPQSDENTRSNAISELTKIFNPSMESQIFKCGGKLQQLVTKFGKGGGIDCGCGGIKLNQRGGVTGPFNNVPDRYYNENGVFLGYGNDPRTMDYINSRGNDRTWTVARSNGIANTTNQSRMLWNPEALPEPYDVSSFTRLADGTVTTLRQQPSINRSNYVETKQDGGTVELTPLPGHDVNTTLTRRQAKQLAMDKGRYANNAQFQTAMANAMNALRNQGLRGKELRERAREMAAGISPAQRSIVEVTPTIQQLPEGFGNVAKITAPAQLVLPETQTLLDSMLDQTNTTLTKRLQTSGKRTGDQKPVFVGSTPAPKKAPTPEQQARVARGQSREQANIPVSQSKPVSIVGTPSGNTNSGYNGSNGSITPIERHGLSGTAYSFNSGKYGPDGLPLGFSSYQEVIPEQPNIVRTGRDDAGNYYEVTDGIRGVNTNNNLYIKTSTKPSTRNSYGNIVPAGGGSFSWMSFKSGGKVESKEGIKLAKCGKKVKK